MADDTIKMKYIDPCNLLEPERLNDALKRGLDRMSELGLNWHLATPDEILSYAGMPVKKMTREELKDIYG